MDTMNTSSSGHCAKSNARDVVAVAKNREAGSAKSITNAFNSATWRLSMSRLQPARSRKRHDGEDRHQGVEQNIDHGRAILRSSASTNFHKPARYQVASQQKWARTRWCGLAIIARQIISQELRCVYSFHSSSTRARTNREAFRVRRAPTESMRSWRSRGPLRAS